jgi:hypothetical protein
MILDILRIMVGLPLALFLPGYLLALIFFKELNQLEKVALGFVLSICVDIALGLFLGYNKAMKDITGGITAANLWFYLSAITLLLGAVVLFMQRKPKHHESTHLVTHHETVHPKTGMLAEHQESEAKEHHRTEQVAVYQREESPKAHQTDQVQIYERTEPRITIRMYNLSDDAIFDAIRNKTVAWILIDDLDVDRIRSIKNICISEGGDIGMLNKQLLVACPKGVKIFHPDNE